MATLKRSKWKGPFIDPSFMTRVLFHKKRHGVVRNTFKTKARQSTILPLLFNYKLEVYNGLIYVPLTIRSEMGGHKLGEFILTRKRHIYTKKKTKHGAKSKSK